MISDVWLNNARELRAGTELFRSDRTFQMLAYTATHRQLMLVSQQALDDGPPETTIEILFKPVDAVHLDTWCPGLVITCATEDQAERIAAGLANDDHRSSNSRVFVLNSQGVCGYVVSGAVGWREGVLPRMQQSLFNPVESFDSVWPTRPMWGPDGSLNLASPAEVAQAFLTGVDDGARRPRYRYVYVLLAKDPEGSEPHAVGVFLTEADAEEAAGLLRPKIPDCWIERKPMVL